MNAVLPVTPNEPRANTLSGPAKAVEPSLPDRAHPNLALLYGGTRGAARSSDEPASRSGEATDLS